MEPFKAKLLPMEYNIDKELLKLIAEANEKYGEYKSYLKNLEFDSKFFLNSILLMDDSDIEAKRIILDCHKSKF